MMYVVHEILATDEQSRNSDPRLICLYWMWQFPSKIYNVEVKGETRPKQGVILKDIVECFETSETITRIRRKIQNDLGLYQPTIPTVAKARIIKEEEWRENMRNNFTKEQTKAIVEMYVLAKNKSKVDVRKIKNEIRIKHGL